MHLSTTVELTSGNKNSDSYIPIYLNANTKLNVGGQANLCKQGFLLTSVLLTSASQWRCRD
jgi:hypothetical protein